MNGLIGISILAAIPFFIIMLLVKLGFAAVCKHRDRKTLKVIGITSIFSSFLSIQIYNSVGIFIDSPNILWDLICCIITVLVIFFLEGLVYYKFAPSIKHPFYFALAMNAFLWFFIEALTLILDKVNI